MLKISLSVMHLQRSQLLNCVLKCVYSLSDIVDMCFCTEINISIPIRLLDGSGNLLSRGGNSGIVKCGSKSVISGWGWGERERERERAHSSLPAPTIP